MGSTRCTADGAEPIMSWFQSFLEEDIFLLRDYSQLEVRILAQFSQDKLLCSQFNTGEDIHPQVGHEILGWPIEVIKKEEKARVIAKGIHFGIIYGSKPKAIWKKCLRYGIKVSLQEITDAYNRYFKRYRGVKEWIEYAIGYTERCHHSLPTLFGRSRPVRVDDPGNHESHWANVAVNTPIQGTAGDFALYCLALIRRNPNYYTLLRHSMRNEIHDSLVATVILQVLHEADEKFQYLMEEHCVTKAHEDFGIKMLVPLLTDAKVGFRFGTMVKFNRNKQDIETVLNAWCEKNAEIETVFHKDPLRFVDLQRGAVS